MLKNIKFDKNLIKDFFWKYTIKGGVVTVKCLGFILQYADSTYYEKYIETLEYLKPYLDNDSIKFLNNLKVKHGRINVDEFKKDKDKYCAIIKTINPKVVKTADGELRKFQLNLLDFVKTVYSDIEANTDIKPFMIYGTLLGAIRNGGYIPWDDDIDFALMRPEYLKLKEYLFNRYPRIDTSDWVRLQYTTKIATYKEEYKGQTVVLENFDTLKLLKFDDDRILCVDFFVYDYYSDEHNLNTLVSYVKTTKKKCYEIEKFKDKFEFYNSEISKGKDIVKDSDVIGPGIGTCSFNRVLFKDIIRKNDIYPLQKIKFEDTEFWAPNSPSHVLKQEFNFYDKMPEVLVLNKHNVL